MRAGLVFITILPLSGQVNVTTYHNDLARSGANLEETILTPANVQPGKFGPLFREPVDGQIYAQPLYLSLLNIPGKGIHNVVFVATEHDSVYAFDADSRTGPDAAPLWHVSFLDPARGVTAVPSESVQCEAISPEIGVTGTPAIDPASGTLYVVAMTLENFGQSYVQRLHALDVVTGAERPGSPVEIQAAVPGQGDGNNMVRFNPGLYKERPGLLLLNGVVYTAWSSHCDGGRYHGWLIGYDAHTLKQVAVYTSTPDWDAGSFWQSGAAPAADEHGNIYVVAGNGTFDADSGGSDLGESVIKLATSQGLAVADYFTPFNADWLTATDRDLGSSGTLLLPDADGSPAHPHLLVTGSKEGRLYVLDRDGLGHFQSDSDSQIVQSLPQTIGPLYGVPAYFNHTLYFSGGDDALKALPIAGGLLAGAPSSQAPESFGDLGSVPSISANGSTSGIVWTIDSTAMLRAYDAANLANELYRGGLDSYVKFATPTIANGKVYAGSHDALQAFGLLGAPRISAAVNAAGFQPGAVAPGSIISVFGENLAARTEIAPGSPLPVSLGGTKLLINGVAAPLVYASSTQLNAQVPYETSLGIATLQVVRGDEASAPAGIPIQPAAPGIFSVVLNQDGSINGPHSAAVPGSSLQVFLTGLGPSDGPQQTGVAAQTNPLASQDFGLDALIGNQAAGVLSAAPAPGMVGVYQVSVRVPSQPPGVYPLTLQAAGVSSNSVAASIGP